MATLDEFSISVASMTHYVKKRLHNSAAKQKGGVIGHLAGEGGHCSILISCTPTPCCDGTYGLFYNKGTKPSTADDFPQSDWIFIGSYHQFDGMKQALTECLAEHGYDREMPRQDFNYLNIITVLIGFDPIADNVVISVASAD